MTSARAPSPTCGRPRRGVPSRSVMELGRVGDVKTSRRRRATARPRREHLPRPGEVELLGPVEEDDRDRSHAVHEVARDRGQRLQQSVASVVCPPYQARPRPRAAGRAATRRPRRGRRAGSSVRLSSPKTRSNSGVARYRTAPPGPASRPASAISPRSTSDATVESAATPRIRAIWAVEPAPCRRRSRASRAPPARAHARRGARTDGAHASAASRAARKAEPPAARSRTMPLRPSR